MGDLAVDDGSYVADNHADGGDGIYQKAPEATERRNNTLIVCSSTVTGNHADCGRGGV